MNKPKYKLGDIVYDRKCDSTELVVSIENMPNDLEYVYETMVIEGRRERAHDRWLELTLDEWYVVIGNMLEGKRC